MNTFWGCFMVSGFIGGPILLVLLVFLIVGVIGLISTAVEHGLQAALWSAVPAFSVITGLAMVLVLAFMVNRLGYRQVGGIWYYLTWDAGQGLGRTQLNVDLETFLVLRGGYYARDARQVFYQGRVLQGARAASFRVDRSDPRSASDDTSRYHEGDRVGDADPAAFRFVGERAGGA